MFYVYGGDDGVWLTLHGRGSENKLYVAAIFLFNSFILRYGSPDNPFPFFPILPRRYALCKDPDGAARLRARPDLDDPEEGGLSLTGYQAKELIRAVTSPKDPNSLHAAEVFRKESLVREENARKEAAAASEKLQKRLVDRKTTISARTQVSVWMSALFRPQH